MAEVLIFRICQNADVARTAELSHSIRDHSMYPPFQCIAIVQSYLETAHSCDGRCKEDAWAVRRSGHVQSPKASIGEKTYEGYM